jgi:hypothetical protein
MNLRSAFESVCDAAGRAPYVIPAHTILKSKRQDLSRSKKFEISKRADQFVVSTYKIIGSTWTAVPTEFQYLLLDKKIEQLSDLFETSLSPNLYRDLVYTQDTEEYGRIKSRLFAHMNTDGQNFSRLFPSGACAQCGVTLPLDALQVDDRCPQAGGDLEAIAKVFRACRLTCDGPQELDANSATSPERSYSLNTVGSCIYSFALQVWNFNDLATPCLHNVLNLRMLCPACDSHLAHFSELQGI